MTLVIEKPHRSNYWILFLVVLFLAVTIVFLPKLIPQKFTSAPLAFEIAGFEGDAQIYDAQSHSWRAPKRGEEFLTSQKIKTGADGIVNFKVEREMMFRLKGDSELENKESKVADQKEVYKLNLKRGILLGATGKSFDRKQAAQKADLQIRTPEYLAAVHGAMYRIQAPDGSGKGTHFGVLRGSMEVAKSALFGKSRGVTIRGLERVIFDNGMMSPVQKVSQVEWQELNEAYELLQMSAAQEAEQIDLSKAAGTLFQNIFDHGTFYTPNLGYAIREFYKDPDSGDVILEIEYDVFPAASFDGVYLKTRNFDISQHAGFSFEVRRKADEGVPDSFSIEVKSKGNVIRRFAARGFERNWKQVSYDFHARKPTPVNELVFVFTNERVGEAKKGILQFRNLNLIPLPEPEMLAKTKAVATVFPQTPPAQQVTSQAGAAKTQDQSIGESGSAAIPKEIPLQ